MADDAQSAAATSVPVVKAEQSWDKKQKEKEVIADEIAAISSRRGSAVTQSGNILDVVGLALSGGGIRSSAICLGVLQALNHHDLIKRIDYLSTVSGGGYIGSSLSATMTQTGEFVFGKVAADGSTMVAAGEISDTPAVGHIRNYSNYLMPAGARDVLTGIAIVCRGLVANLSLTLPVVLILAAITIWSTPLRTCLSVANFFGVDLGADDTRQCELHHFTLIDGHIFTFVGVAMALLSLAIAGGVYLLSSGIRGTGPSVAAGAALPLIIWIGYLYLSYWGIANDAVRCLQPSPASVTQNGCASVDLRKVAGAKNLAGKIQFDSSAGTLSAEIEPRTDAAAPVPERSTPTSHAPAWLETAAKKIAGIAGWSGCGLGHAFSLPVVILYIAVAALLFRTSWSPTPNANSLHRLYRDRLSKAFLFDPRPPNRIANASRSNASRPVDQGRDYEPLDRIRLSELCPKPGGLEAPELRAPYHLINTALNIQGSDFAN
jgi:patatin-like phospholipase